MLETGILLFHELGVGGRGCGSVGVGLRRTLWPRLGRLVTPMETAVCETSPMPSSCLQVRSSPSRSSTIHAHCQDGYILAMMHSRSRSDTAPATFLSQARPVCAYGGGASMCSAMRRSTMSSSLSTVSIAVSMAVTSPSPLLTASHASCSVSELFFSWSLHT